MYEFRVTIICTSFTLKGRVLDRILKNGISWSQRLGHYFLLRPVNSKRISTPCRMAHQLSIRLSDDVMSDDVSRWLIIAKKEKKHLHCGTLLRKGMNAKMTKIRYKCSEICAGCTRKGFGTSTHASRNLERFEVWNIAKYRFSWKCFALWFPTKCLNNPKTFTSTPSTYLRLILGSFIIPYVHPFFRKCTTVMKLGPKIG